MGTHNLKITLLKVLSNWRQSKTFCYVTGIALFITLLSCLPRFLSSLSVFDARGELDISLVGEVRPGPSYPDPVLTKRADFPTLFKTEFLFLIPCLRHLTRNHTLCKTIINIETLSYLIHWQSQNYLQLDQQSHAGCLSSKKRYRKSIPWLRQKSRKTYPGWPHVPIKPL